ncbi:MAG: hypothetical protein Roseis2KO_37750 [Roseivirga sp.]
MGNPKSKSQLTAGFERLIYTEDHKGFFKALGQVEPSSEIWAGLQIRSIDLLMRLGSSAKAIEKAGYLKSILTDPVLRRHAKIKYLHLERAINRNDQNHSLEQECQAVLIDPDFESLHLLTKGILLRLAATELMCGLTEAQEKKSLIGKYLAHIKVCQHQGRSEEAYCHLIELLQFVMSKPMPMAERALAYLHYYRKLPFIANTPHRLATLDLQIAEIRLTNHLEGDHNKDHQKYYLLAGRSFARAKHLLGHAYIQKSQGQTLLRYGKSRGRQLLYEAIRSFEGRGKQLQSLEIHTTIIQWLETKGEQSAIRSYLIKVNTLRENLLLTGVKTNSISPVIRRSDEPNLAEQANYTIAIANDYAKAGDKNMAIRLLQKSIRKIRQSGETIHLARLLACHAEMLNDTIESGGLPEVKVGNQAIALFIRLGYPLEAVCLVRKRLLNIGLSAQSHTFTQNFSDFIKSDMDLIESILQCRHDLASREILAKSHQTIAYLYLTRGAPKKGIEILKKNSSLLKKHRLTYMLAFNEMYLGSILLEMCDHHTKNECCLKAYDHFSEAYQLFKVMNNYEACWRSQFGMALSIHKDIAQSTNKSTLLIQRCSEHYLRAIDATHYLTVHHQKTAIRFGEPFVFSTRLQKGADQLYATAIDYFTGIAHDSATIGSLIEKKRVWFLLNRSHPEIKIN